MTRKRLPPRRAHEVFKFGHWGHSYIVGLGRAPGSTKVSEVFINCGKSGEQVQTLARDSAVLLSLALQHGATIEAMRHAVTRNPDGSASGPIGALLDLLAEGDGLSEAEPSLPVVPKSGNDSAESTSRGEAVEV